jgi:hypothetical protein
MAKRKQDAGKAEPDPTSSPVLYTRLPKALQRSLDRYLAEDPTEPNRQDTGVAALIMFLEAKGYWPPPTEK